MDCILDIKPLDPLRLRSVQALGFWPLGTLKELSSRLRGGTVNESHQLLLDELLPIPGPKRVRVIVLYSPVDEWNEKEWLHTATLSPAFDFLKDPEEDIYTLSDGKPYHDEA